MKINKFWKFQNKVKNEGDKPNIERVLFLNGTIAEESWFDDDITPGIFKDELMKEKGDLTVWINSPGGDVFAAAQIYNMLIDYKDKVIVKIDGIAASAASVIAMAGDEIYMSPVSMLMIHNPMTGVFGDKNELKKAVSMLDEVKESIINAYISKSNLSRDKISNLMDSETWMNANKALELGFCSGILERNINDDIEMPNISTSFSEVKVVNSFIEKVKDKSKINTKTKKVKADQLMDRLFLIKNWR
ncbi:MULTISPECIES: head maturation protease, ClpP-related [Helcococcus]|uniref:ATP-dependent Clp protease proteolytic subunit n=1 Tax=Helcococcus bovis TaxID=3153252 RepID=A0ABW9F5M9_9FIRM